MRTHMRTSIDIPDPLLKRARSVARKRNTTLRAVLLEGLSRALEDEGTTAPYSLPDESFGEGGLVEGLSPGEWDRIAALAYEGRGG